MSQKKRKLEEEKRKTTKEEVDKLINVRFIREAWYTTCLTSAITVKKANEKWKMCIDYTKTLTIYIEKWKLYILIKFTRRWGRKKNSEDLSWG